jgi:hypothetical protein
MFLYVLDVCPKVPSEVEGDLEESCGFDIYCGLVLLTVSAKPYIEGVGSYSNDLFCVVDLSMVFDEPPYTLSSFDPYAFC